MVSDVLSLDRRIPAWQVKLEQLQHLKSTLFNEIATIQVSLAGRARAEDPALLERLNMDPALPRASGYGLLPEIVENEPLQAVVPRQTTYSMKWLEDRLIEERANAECLSEQHAQYPDLESLVGRFEHVLGQLRHLEDHLSYHGQWQPSVVEYPEYFQEKNRLLAKIREIESLKSSGGTDARVEQMLERLMDDLASFRPTPGLASMTSEDGERTLPVTVCTDISDVGFLLTYQQAVIEAFNEVPAARSHRFFVELNWRFTDAEQLYPQGVPVRGEDIDVDRHILSFKDCPLILTTGASTTHAMTGEYIVLGTDAVSRRELAHEFAHLLGFYDNYVRGYDGDPTDEYGVVLVEWVGLTDDLMGSARGGVVSPAMIERLATAY
jgi:hypothetical protein